VIRSSDVRRRCDGSVMTDFGFAPVRTLVKARKFYWQAGDRMDWCEQTKPRYSHPVCCQDFPVAWRPIGANGQSSHGLLDEQMRPSTDAFVSEKSVSQSARR